MSVSENVGRCPRCNEFIIAEQTHCCDFRNIQLQGCEELFVDHITDSGKSKDGDHVFLAWGLDGILYRLAVCKHNPPHSAKRKFTGYDTKQGLDRAVEEILYTGFFTCSNNVKLNVGTRYSSCNSERGNSTVDG